MSDPTEHELIGQPGHRQHTELDVDERENPPRIGTAQDIRERIELATLTVDEHREQHAKHGQPERSAVSGEERTETSSRYGGRW